MKKAKRLFAFMMMMIFIISQQPLLLKGDDNAADEEREILAFDMLPEEIASQRVALGASLEDLKLPVCLKAIVRIGKLEEIPMEDTKEEALQDTASQSEDDEELLETESADIQCRSSNHYCNSGRSKCRICCNSI